MSSNDVLVSREKWDGMKRSIENDRSFIIDSEHEIKRLNELKEEREKEREKYAELSKAVLDSCAVNLSDMYDSWAGDLIDRKIAEIKKDGDTFANELSAVRSNAHNVCADAGALDAKINAVAAEYYHALDCYAKAIADEAERASFEVNELNKLVERINELNPARFAINEYNKLMGDSANINANLASDNFGAALMQAQLAVASASSLLVRLISLNESYNAEYVTVRERMDELLNKRDSLVSEGAKLEVLNSKYAYDINFWSFGKFSKFSEEVEYLERLLIENRMDLEGLRKVGSNIDILSSNLQQLDHLARFELGCAIIVAERRDELIESMEENGWMLVEDGSGYKDNDERNPYHALFENGSGNQISVVINSEDSEKAETISEVFVEDMDDTELIERIKDATVDTLLGGDYNNVEVYVNDDCEENTDSDTFVENTMNNVMDSMTARRKTFM